MDGCVWQIMKPILMVVALSALAGITSASPLLTGPMPLCGDDNAKFRELLAGIDQQRKWTGKRINNAGQKNGLMEMTAGRLGKWSLFFRFEDPGGKKKVCLVARGTMSRGYFGRPM